VSSLTGGGIETGILVGDSVGFFVGNTKPHPFPSPSLLRSQGVGGLVDGSVSSLTGGGVEAGSLVGALSPLVLLELEDDLEDFVESELDLLELFVDLLESTEVLLEVFD